MARHAEPEPVFAPNAFAGHLASENGWTPGRAGVVVRSMLQWAGLRTDEPLTELDWLGLSAGYFAAAPKVDLTPVGAW